jgi:predicted RNA-binding Zn ribbon-like protein
MTGQVNFNSHTDAVVAVSAELVNTATPGSRRGRPYPLPADGELTRALTTALRARGHMDAIQARKLVAAAGRLRVVFELADRGEIDAAARSVNALLDELRPTPYLERHDGQPWHLHYHARDQDLADGWAASCAIALATVLGSEYADRLGVCSAPGCDRVFVDVSRNGMRRFCSTACQNRVKAAAHRARQT